MVKEVVYQVLGISGMLMHNARLSNPLNEWTKEIKKVSSKRKKSDEDHEEMARLEFMGGLYTDGSKFIIPSANWEATLVDAAKKLKLGKLLKSAMFINEDSELSSSGPKTPEKRWADPECRDQRSVKVGQARIIRTRPLFKDWFCEVKVLFETELIDLEQLDTIFSIAGKQIGIGDYRPKFGRFEVTR